MAGSSRYTAVLDANVLYPTLVRDLLMSLAIEGLYHAKWSAQIHDEWVRNLAKNRPEIADRLPAVVAVMNDAIPDSVVTGYEALIPSLELPDADDRHVLAVAIVGHADAIVTYNLADFPQEALDRYHVEAQHPDRFVANQLSLHKVTALTAVKKMRARWKHPSKTAEELIGLLHERRLPLTADALSEAIDLI